MTLEETPNPWHSVVGDPEPYPIGSLVYGALEAYDLTDLLETLSEAGMGVTVSGELNW